MKFLLTIFLFTFSFWTYSSTIPSKPVSIPQEAIISSSNDFQVALFSPRLLSNTLQVPQYNKLELGIDLPNATNQAIKRYIHHVFKGQKINPFDSAQIDVYALFKHVESGEIYRVNGFYYEEFRRHTSHPQRARWRWEEDTTSYIFRLRFAHGQAGAWEVSTHVTLKGDQKMIGPSFKFEMISSNSPGFIKLNESGGKYLSTERGQDMFFIGENLAWTEPYEKLEPRSALMMRKWQEELAGTGANLHRVGTSPGSFGFEWEQRGNYGRHPNTKGQEVNRQINAWEFDHVVKSNDDLGLYMLVFIDTHNEFMDSCDMSWIPVNTGIYNNPYRDLIEREDFFTNDSCKHYYKRKLRYFVARWGYSQSILCYEILSEVDNFFRKEDEENCDGTRTYHTKRSNRNIMKSWYAEMVAYVKYLDHKAIVSGSYAVKEQKKVSQHIWPEVDLILGHKYTIRQDENFNVKMDFLKNYTRNRFTKDKPIILDECGPDRGDLIYASDMTLHNTIWSTSFMGTFGCGMVWWWDRGLHANGSYKEFTPLSNYFKNESLNKYNYQAHVYSDVSAKRKRYTKASVEYYSLVAENKSRALVWAHNLSYWWANQYETDPQIKAIIDNTKEKKIVKDKYYSYEVTHTSEGLERIIAQSNRKFTEVQQALIVQHLNKNTPYTVEVWSTVSGTMLEKLTLQSDRKGRITLGDEQTKLLNENSGDLALKIYE